MWASDSGELFYVDPDSRIVAVPIQAGPGFLAGNPRAIIDKPIVATFAGAFGRMYDVSRDGQRFLIVKSAASSEPGAPPPQIVVVQNWTEELKRLAPVN